MSILTLYMDFFSSFRGIWGDDALFCIPLCCIVPVPSNI